MKLIKAGAFLTGEGEDLYVNDFWIGTQPVTNIQYECFIDDTGYQPPEHWGGAKFYKPTSPVTHVSWYDAMAYCEWADFRLPTVIEWEKAARGGLVGKLYPWGDEPPNHQMANYGRYRKSPTPWGLYPCNGYGLYDMTGNVAEWCLRDKRKGSLGLYASYAPVRGGSWSSSTYESSQMMTCLRIATKASMDTQARTDDTGFRVVKDLPIL